MALNAAKREPYRDKYSKFTWSSHFGFNSISDKDNEIPADQALVFRNIETGVCATRAPAGVTDGKLLDDGVETTWFAQLGDWKFDVVSRVRFIGEYEERTHQITAPPEAVGKVEVARRLLRRCRRLACDAASMVHLWPSQATSASNRDDGDGQPDPREGVVPAGRSERSPAPQMTFASIAYASPMPLAKDDVLRRGEELKSAWKA